jgi:signal transduction histidine kinase
MADAFPTSPRAPGVVRASAFAWALAVALLATRTTITSSEWVGRPFPGFMLLDNRVIASVGLPGWSGASVSDLYQAQVATVDGRSVRSASEVYAWAASLPVGTQVRYGLLRDGRENEVAVRTQRFSRADWALLFGGLLLCGITYVASGIVVWLLRPGPTGRAFVAISITWGLYLLTAMDLYGPSTFFRLHAASEALMAPALLQLAAVFPEPRRWARWRLAGYVPALVLLILYQWYLYQPHPYTVILQTNMAYLGLAGILLGAQLVWAYVRGRSAVGSRRVRVVTLWTVLAMALPGAVLVTSAIMGGRVSINLTAFAVVPFPLALAYAIVKHDLFHLDAMVKRSAYYLLLTGAVGAAYMGAIFLFDRALPGAVSNSALFPILFTLAVLALFDPLREFVQGVLDRVFFRTAYDGAQVLEAVGAELASALTREHIARLIRDSVQSAIPNGGTRLFVGSGAAGFEEVGGIMVVPPILPPFFSRGRVLTDFDSVEGYPDAGTAARVRDALAVLEAELAVPVRADRELVGVLTVGAKRSGLFYTPGDAAFLRALAHQTAIALQNAASYEELVALNATLEERVQERTAEVEASNRDLAAALHDLQQTQVQLVQSEKMASLGRLVAGVAHEINNPVSFISTSVAPLRRRIERVAAAAPAELRQALDEADEIVGIMARGAERTAAIVHDLRSFSRLGEATRKPVDLCDGIDTSLRLLESRWRDRITVHRDYREVPLVECDPGQVNQVFMNVLANACDAVVDGRNVWGNIWISTRPEGDGVEVAIRDDGTGIAPEALGRIFDPFFTTKDVGGGTGLGLAISHGIVTAHGGRITVESTPGDGTIVRIWLPIAQAKSLDSVASGSR